MSLESPNKSALAQGVRIRFLRDKIAKVNLINFAATAEVNKNTLSTWETGDLAKPILAKNFEKLIKAFNQYGIEVSERWLRAGEGDMPKLNGQSITFDANSLFISANSSKDGSSTTQHFDNLSNILNKNLLDELKTFSSIKDAILTKVEHGGFLPLLEKGDWVGGVWQDSSILVEPKLCIVEIKLDVQHLAILTPTKKKQHFDMSYLNNSTNFLANHDKKDVFFERVAPVIRYWH